MSPITTAPIITVADRSGSRAIRSGRGAIRSGRGAIRSDTGRRAVGHRSGSHTGSSLQLRTDKHPRPVGSRSVLVAGEGAPVVIAVISGGRR
jgi:hypothetical protein